MNRYKFIWFTMALGCLLMFGSVQTQKCDPDFFSAPWLCDESENGFLVFTAFDMNKICIGPDTSFSNVYSGVNVNLWAWAMVPSSQAQQDISLLFGLPNDYTPAGPLEIKLYLFADRQIAKGDTANIRVRTDSKSNLQEMGQTFLASNTTGDFPILEPVLATDLESIIVSTTITTTGIKPGNLMLFVFDRVVTTSGEEYRKNIYLNSVVVKYPKI